jgi:hypothetical protein
MHLIIWIKKESESLKEIVKNNILVVLATAFIIGAVIICTFDYFLWFDIDAQEKVDATILWLTSLAIFWYAYEAYQLKLSTSKQTENQEEIMLNEFLPILAPAERKMTAILQNGNLKNFYIYNFGKGPAKYVEVFVGKVKICSGHSVSKGEHEEIKVDLIARPDLRGLIEKSHPKLSMRLCYEDIYGRKFKSENILLDREGTSKKYILRKGSWDFKRIRSK